MVTYKFVGLVSVVHPVKLFHDLLPLRLSIIVPAIFCTAGLSYIQSNANRYNKIFT